MRVSYRTLVIVILDSGVVECTLHSEDRPGGMLKAHVINPLVGTPLKFQAARSNSTNLEVSWQNLAEFLFNWSWVHRINPILVLYVFFFFFWDACDKSGNRITEAWIRLTSEGSWPKSLTQTQLVSLNGWIPQPFNPCLIHKKWVEPAYSSPH